MYNLFIIREGKSIKMDFTVDDLIALQLYVADTIDDPSSAPQLASSLLFEDITVNQLMENNILLKQFIDDIFHHSNSHILEHFEENKSGLHPPFYLKRRKDKQLLLIFFFFTAASFPRNLHY